MNPGPYKFELSGRPDFAFLKVVIPAGASLKVENSAMATMTPNLKLSVRLKGGLARFVGGESLFLSEYTAVGQEGEIGIAPGAPGDMEHFRVQGAKIYLASSAFVAATPGVVIDTEWQGLTRGFFSGQSHFLIRCSGDGDLWFNTFGALVEIDVKAGYVVDTSYVVAFTEGLDYKVETVGGYRSLFLSGEGLVCRFSGQGKLWIQTRQAPAFAHWLEPFRLVRPKTKGGD